ncbi:MAG TPA: spore protease YyaC [Bacillota bacterium]|nr:spore protease YyaC [Bacillota bacterium]
MNLNKRFISKKENFRLEHTHPDLEQTLSQKIISWLPSAPREYIIVCIGTDRSTGDSLGPLTGTLLMKKKPRHLTIYGTLAHPVHATNLSDYVKAIGHQHRLPFIIAIDACLGKTSSVGHVIASQGALKPGAALNKPLPEIGDIHVTGVVNIGGFMEYSVLQNTRLAHVVQMAEKIADTFDLVDQRLTYDRTTPAVVLPQTNDHTLSL